MIYGMYLSASGMLANLHRQDVVANNLANSQTVGFKRHLAVFQQRMTEADARGDHSHTNPAMEPLGGGLLLSPTAIDFSQGELERVDNPLHAALVGDGFFALRAPDGAQYFTRDGRFGVNREGQLALETQPDHLVLDINRNPISVQAGVHVIDEAGHLLSNGRQVGQVGIFDVPDRRQLTSAGGNRFTTPDAAAWQGAPARVVSGFVEMSNAEPARELSTLIDSQRQLEIHANMIRLQDQTLGRLVNDVAKIS